MLPSTLTKNFNQFLEFYQCDKIRLVTGGGGGNAYYSHIRKVMLFAPYPFLSLKSPMDGIKLQPVRRLRLQYVFRNGNWENEEKLRDARRR